MLLKNFLKEGKDYKNLKSDLKEIIEANNMDDSKLKSKGKGFLHCCKRILQVCYDITAITAPVLSVGGTIAQSVAISKVNTGLVAAFGGSASIPIAPMIIGAIVGLVINFILNRLIRLLIDTIEYKNLEGDVNEIIKTLRRMSKDATKKSDKEKYDKQADKLEESLSKYR